MRINGLIITRSGGGPVLPRAVAAARADDAGVDLPKETEDGLPIMDVRFSPFNSWYRIDSFWEGSFMERTVPGAFKKTMREQGSNIKVLFNHGGDFSIGDKVLGVPTRAVEEDDSPLLEVPLLRTSYNADLEPGLRAGAYGSSFMFEVLRDKWDHEPEATEENPDALPERTIQEVRLFEAGPVTWPANPAATAGLRGGSDMWLSMVKDQDADRFEDMVRSFKAFRAAHDLEFRPRTEPTLSPSRHTGDSLDAAARNARLRNLRLAQIRTRIERSA